ncbi:MULTISPECIES: TetR/AcrR family transcriptional regulator [Pseudomonas]|nr:MULTISPECIES: TetR/AcrR family transcriptional regulator [Pseudomonas]MCW6058152.1 TetR/AcrR family transcriptional regulator [Pseudomonas fragi]EGH71971.1 regulatory protein, TetR [Pseudomonas syringae pv. aceris str. M302273]KOG02720.1 Regulatory protein, TetR [Pseudomonas syringae pv. aceris]KPB22883.1 Regulatory protein [Pseudomonas syringae pv. syringae]KPW07733.1 Regulatory protein, TetR [Pseudomonas syringae pv. aceris]
MGSSKADKATSHDRIINVAAAQIRRSGINGIGVADLMQEAGLTHGGFYRHFESRDELVTAAVERALAQGSARTVATCGQGGRRALEAIIDDYLSPAHRALPEGGCAVAGLAEDISRTNDRTRSAYARQVELYLELLAGLTPTTDAYGDRRRSCLLLSAMVGALAMARAIGEGGLSDEILSETATALKEL